MAPRAAGGHAPDAGRRDALRPGAGLRPQGPDRGGDPAFRRLVPANRDIGLGPRARKTGRKRETTVTNRKRFVIRSGPAERRRGNDARTRPWVADRVFARGLRLRR